MRGVCTSMLVAATALCACGLTVTGTFDGPLADAAPPGTSSGGAPTDASAVYEVGGPVGGGYGAVVLADAPLLYYRLEEATGAAEVLSEIAGSPSAKVQAMPTLGVAGKLGNAIGFNGTTDGYLEVDHPASQFTGAAPFTLEAWAFPRGSDGAYRHIFIRDTNDQNGGRNAYGVWIHDAKLGFERFSDGAASKAVSDVVAFNAWYHVVAVYDGVNVSLWLNGVRVAEEPDNRRTKMKDRPLRFGTRDPMTGRFNGSIDEVAVYDRALTEERIKAHFQASAQY